MPCSSPIGILICDTNYLVSLTGNAYESWILSFLSTFDTARLNQEITETQSNYYQPTPG